MRISSPRVRKNKKEKKASQAIRNIIKHDVSKFWKEVGEGIGDISKNMIENIPVW